MHLLQKENKHYERGAVGAGEEGVDPVIFFSLLDDVNSNPGGY
jgi:hypothetical protein